MWSKSFGSKYSITFLYNSATCSGGLLNAPQPNAPNTTRLIPFLRRVLNCALIFFNILDLSNLSGLAKLSAAARSSQKGK